MNDSSQFNPSVSASVASAHGGAEIPAFHHVSYIEWPAIFAGTVVALAVTFALLAFGSAAGLAAVSPWTSTRTTVSVVTFGAALWLMLIHIWAFSLGGYFATRLRHRHAGASQKEVEFRDGAHGAVVWGLGVTTGAMFAALIAALLIHGGTQAAANGGNDPVNIATDQLLRTARPAPGIAAGDFRDETNRIISRSSTRAGARDTDRAYLAEIVAARTGLSPVDASKRVDETLLQLKDAINKARKSAVIMGFVTAATLLIGFAAAWWGGTVGGKHRDEGTVWDGFASHTAPFR